MKFMGPIKKELEKTERLFLLCLISFEFGLAVEIRVPGVHLIESLTSIKFPVVWRRLCQGVCKYPTGERK